MQVLWYENKMTLIQKAFSSGLSILFYPIVLRRGVATFPQTVFAPVLKNAQPRDKIAPGTFKFILFPHFSEKISNLPPSPEVG